MMPTCNVASWLPIRATEDPHRPAIYAPAGCDHAGRTRYLRVNFRELDADSDRIAHGLRALGIGPGHRCVLMIPPSLDFFACVFALFKAGAVLVAIDPGIGLRRFKHCVEQASPSTFIGIGKAQWARRLLGWGRSHIATVITTDGRDNGKIAALGQRHHQLADVRRRGEHGGDPLPAVADPQDEAAILFTSGSTGAPKGACYRHGNFNAQLEALRALYQITPGEVDLATFPLFALYAPALGMTAVIPDMDFTKPGSVDPERIRGPIAAFGVSNLFGSPALLNRVGRHAVAAGWRFPSLKRVVSAGAPVPVAVHRIWRQLLEPGVEVFTPYGATECLPVASIGSDQVLGETAKKTEQGAGVCVGEPTPGLELTIIPISDDPIAHWRDVQPLPPGQIGEICVRAAQATSAYFEHEHGTRLAKIPTADGDSYHRMGDLGYQDEHGRIWFCGRKSQRVRNQAGELYTVPIEARFNAHEAVYRSALVGVGPIGRQRPVICIELEPNITTAIQDNTLADLRKLADSINTVTPIRDILFHPGFPTDTRHNAKIGREQLRRWATRRLGRQA